MTERGLEVASAKLILVLVRSVRARDQDLVACAMASLDRTVVCPMAPMSSLHDFGSPRLDFPVERLIWVFFPLIGKTPHASRKRFDAFGIVDPGFLRDDIKPMIRDADTIFDGLTNADEKEEDDDEEEKEELEEGKARVAACDFVYLRNSNSCCRSRHFDIDAVTKR